jgi:F-box interacting protein
MADDVLPQEILTEILSRLPVQSLLRFRSTSKSLKSIIDSHNFTNLHLKNSLNRSLILRNKSDIYQLQIDDDDFSNLTTTAAPLKHPFSRNSNKITLIGSCNGLLAISNGVIFCRHPNDANEITIWNPNTRKHRIIPFLSLPITPRSPSDSTCSLCFHGFGFDPVTADYKLLRISWLVSPHNNFYDSHVRLFSLKTNSWKIIPTMPYSLYYVYSMWVFVENSIHLIMTKKLDRLHPLIVAFDLTLEIFNEVPLPAEIGGEEVNSNGSFQMTVAVLGGCLCMIMNYETTKIDVWVMKQYGSRDSWCKLFTLVNSCFTSHFKSSRPLGYSSDGSKVLFEGLEVLLEVRHRKLFWYDLKSEQVSYVEGIPNWSTAMICVESLVPPSFPVDNCRKKENRTSKRRLLLIYFLSFLSSCYMYSMTHRMIYVVKLYAKGQFEFLL